MSTRWEYEVGGVEEEGEGQRWVGLKRGERWRWG